MKEIHSFLVACLIASVFMILATDSILNKTVKLGRFPRFPSVRISHVGKFESSLKSASKDIISFISCDFLSW